MTQLINEPDQNSKNIWSIVAVAIITALVIGGGVYLQQKSVIESERNEVAETVRGEFQQEITDLKNQLSQLKETQETVPVKTPADEEVKPPEPQEPVVKPPVDPMADWKTYRNDDCGFEFKYPREWKIKSKERDTEKTVTVTAHSNSEKYSLEKWLDVYRETSPVGASLGWKEEISLAEEKTLKGGFGCCMNYLQTVFFAKGDKICQISGGQMDFEVKPLGSYYDYEKTFDQILSTFKFVK